MSQCRHRRRPDAPRITSANAPSASLPLRFIAAGLVALALAGAWLLAAPGLLTQYHYGPDAVAFAHLTLLGFAASIVMGVLYQFTPVALDARLHSERLARWHWWWHVVGVAGMVWMFRRWDLKQVGHFGSVFGFGVLFFVWNMARTLARVPRWTPVAFGVASAVGWLLLTMLAGIFAACTKFWPWISPFAPLAQMHAHAHLGVLGFFILLTVAVSYRLVPMFLISAVQSERRAWGSLVLLNVGTGAIALTIALQSAWKLAAALIFIAGLVLYGFELRAILRARLRAALDFGMRSFLTGIALLAVASVVALVLCWPGLLPAPAAVRGENVYAVVGILGVLWFVLIGMLGKILPFFVWFHRYSGDIGRAKVPQLVEMYSERLQAIGYWCHLTGLTCCAIAAGANSRMLATGGCALLAGAVLVFSINAARIFCHMRRPKTPACELPLEGVATSP